MIPSSRNVLRQYAFTDNRHKRFLEGYGKAAQAVALIRLDGGLRANVVQQLGIVANSVL